MYKVITNRYLNILILCLLVFFNCEQKETDNLVKSPSIQSPTVPQHDYYHIFMKQKFNDSCSDYDIKILSSLYIIVNGDSARWKGPIGDWICGINLRKNGPGYYFAYDDTLWDNGIDCEYVRYALDIDKIDETRIYWASMYLLDIKSSRDGDNTVICSEGFSFIGHRCYQPVLLGEQSNYSGSYRLTSTIILDEDPGGGYWHNTLDIVFKGDKVFHSYRPYIGSWNPSTCTGHLEVLLDEVEYSDSGYKAYNIYDFILYGCGHMHGTWEHKEIQWEHGDTVINREVWDFSAEKY